MVLFEKGDLNQGKLSYLLPGHPDLTKVRDLDTVGIFDLQTQQENLLTGFSVALTDSLVGNWWIFLMVLLFIMGGYFLLRKGNFRGLSRDPVLNHLAQLIGKITGYLRKKDLHEASALYQEAHLCYDKLSTSQRKIVHKRLQALYGDILFLKARLVGRECFQALKSGEQNEVLLQYEILQGIYKQLPLKYKSEIYKKISLIYRLMK